MDRREAVEVLVRGTVAGAAVWGAVGPLLGCAGAGGRAGTASVGQPIPADPQLRPVRKAAVVRPTGVPNVIARGQWTKTGPNRAEAKPMLPVKRITVHHDGMSPFGRTGWGDAVQRMEMIRRSHVGDQGWADIGYHYIVDPAGRVWEGRPMTLQGAHVKDQNEGNIGVMVLGNFEEERPTGAATASVEKLVVALMGRHKVRPNNVHTHRELASTACPGRYLQTFMASSRGRGGGIARA